MATLQSAAAKYQDKVNQAGSHWESATKQYGAAHYCEGMSKFLGGNAGRLCANYQAGIARASAASYSAGVQGKAQRWIEGMQRAAMG